jgi:hypothetical protein
MVNSRKTHETTCDRELDSLKEAENAENRTIKLGQKCAADDVAEKQADVARHLVLLCTLRMVYTVHSSQASRNGQLTQNSREP